ncbi:unnamed protein product [Calypogeia fissa]
MGGPNSAIVRNSESLLAARKQIQGPRAAILHLFYSKKRLQINSTPAEDMTPACMQCKHQADLVLVTMAGIKTLSIHVGIARTTSLAAFRHFATS